MIKHSNTSGGLGDWCKFFFVSVLLWILVPPLLWPLLVSLQSDSPWATNILFTAAALVGLS